MTQAIYISADILQTKTLTLFHKIENMPAEDYDPDVFDEVERLIIISYGLSVLANESTESFDVIVERYDIGTDVETLGGLISHLYTHGDATDKELGRRLLLAGSNYFAALDKATLPLGYTLQ